MGLSVAGGIHAQFVASIALLASSGAWLTTERQQNDADSQSQNSSGQVAGAGQPDRNPSLSGLNFANALLNERRYELAAEEYERFLRTRPIGPDQAEATYGLARAQLFLLKYPDARKNLESFLQMAPRHANAPSALFRLAETCYLMQDLQAAKELLDRYLRTYPNHAHANAAWPYLGDVHFGLGELESARQAYEKTLATYPNSPLIDRARYYLARVVAAQGDPDRATELLTALANNDRSEWCERARLQIGQLQLTTSRFDVALATFTSLERDLPPGPSQTEARLRRAEALVGLKRLDEAQRLLTPLTLDRSVPSMIASQAGYTLGEVCWERGQHDQALSTWTAALARAPNAIVAPMLEFRSAEALEKLGRNPEARTRFIQVAERYPKDAWADRALLRAARLAHDAKDYAKARELAARFDSLFPTSPMQPDAQLLAAHAAQQSGDHDSAISSLRKLLVREDLSRETKQAALLYLSQAYKAAGQAEKATKILTDLSSMPETPLSKSAQFSLGQQHFDSGRYAESITPFSDFLKSNEKSELAPHALGYLALAFHELRQDEQSQTALDRLERDWSDHEAVMRVRLRLGESAIDAKQFDRAIELLQGIVNSKSSNWTARASSDLGWALTGADKPADAAAAFAACVDADPKADEAPEAAYMQGWALEEANQLEAALKAYEKADERFAATKHGKSALLARARLFARMDQPENAARVYEKFLHDHPTSSDEAAADQVLLELGQAYSKAGLTPKADTVLRKLIEEYSQSDNVLEGRILLAESAYRDKRIEESRLLLEPVLVQPQSVKATLRERALYRLGRIALDENKLDDARARFSELLDQQPQGTLTEQARFWHAETAYRLGDAQSAESEFAALTIEGPGRALGETDWRDTARLRRVQCLLALSRWNDVLREAERFLEERPTFLQRAELHFARGRALSSQPLPRFDDARTAYQAAIDEQPGTEVAARCQFMRGETFFHEKNYREALREFQQVELLYQVPKWQAAALLEAGKACEALNQRDSARASYQKLVRYYPDDPSATEARKRIEALGP